jgi:hypothetical protein
LSDIRGEEYRFLRQELEMNRKFVFERPLLIVTATLTAAITLTQRELLGVLSLPFLALLAFNLWFTFNRLESSARIVAYIQLVHESDKFSAVRWETALRAYRQWCFLVKKGKAESPEITPEIRQYDSMAYYGPIFYFHLFLAVLVALMLLIRTGLPQTFMNLRAGAMDWLILGLNGVLLLAFGLCSSKFRPSKLHHSIEWKRVWESVFSPKRPNKTDPIPAVGS